MKKIFSILSIACVALLATSCSDEVGNGNFVKPGEPINFTGHILSDGETRTVYGGKTSTGWPINWVAGDKVDVFCPEAQGEDRNASHKNSASYTLTSAATGTNKIYNLTSSENTLYWGESKLHHFYEFYPSGSFNNMTPSADGSKCKVTAILPATQTIDVSKNLTTDGNYTFCNMDYALMAGATSADRTNVPNPLSLKFKPVTTAVDIVIPASDATYEISKLILSNVESETNPSPLAGTYTCDVAETSTGVAVNNYNTITRNNTVEVVFSAPITLAANSNKKLAVTAFLRGDFNKALKVSVIAKTTDIKGDYTDVQIKKESGSNVLFACKRNVMNLPKLPKAPDAAMRGDNWQSLTSNAKYVSQLSLPGAYDAGSYVAGLSGCDRAQNDNGYSSVDASECLKDILNAGSRVLDLQIEHNGTQFVFRRMKSGGTGNPSYTEVPFGDSWKVCVKWLQEHPSEFLVVFLSNRNDNLLSNWTANIKSLVEQNTIKDYVIDFNPNITVEEARGKILFITRNSYDSYRGNYVENWFTKSGTDRKSMSLSFKRGTGTIIVEDYNDLTSGWASESTAMKDVTDTKIPAVKANLLAVASNTNINKWYYTSCACSGHNKGLIASHSTGEVSYAQTAEITNPEICKYINDSANGYGTGAQKSLGIVMISYVCAGDADQQHGKALTDLVWKNNFPNGITEWQKMYDSRGGQRK